MLRAQLSREYDIKAVFLFNFAQFVDWPQESFPDPGTPFIIGVLGNDPFGSILDDIVRNETVRGRGFVVQRFRRVEDIDLCHILFISRSESRRVEQILNALQNRPVLTVSEMEDFPRQGGMIRFDRENAKVRLRINNDKARAAHLNISSKLLRVATVITTTSE